MTVTKLPNDLFLGYATEFPPELSTQFKKYHRELDNEWPAYMDVQESGIMGPLRLEMWLRQFQVYVVHIDPDSNKMRLVGMGNSIPFYWSTPDDNDSLPGGGWDAVAAMGMRQYYFRNGMTRKLKRFKDRNTPDFLEQNWNERHDSGQAPNALCGLAICVLKEFRRQGLPEMIIGKLQEKCRAEGFIAFVVPVRPTRKPEFLTMSMVSYLNMDRDEHAPGTNGSDKLQVSKNTFDPWVRKHMSLGGKPVKIAQSSMVMKAKAKDWENAVKKPGMCKKAWEDGTILKNKYDGEKYVEVMDVPGLLVPMRYYFGKNEGVYCEPNLWIRHERKYGGDHSDSRIQAVTARPYVDHHRGQIVPSRYLIDKEFLTSLQQTKGADDEEENPANKLQENKSQRLLEVIKDYYLRKDDEQKKTEAIIAALDKENEAIKDLLRQNYYEKSDAALVRTIQHLIELQGSSDEVVPVSKISPSTGPALKPVEPSEEENQTIAGQKDDDMSFLKGLIEMSAAESGRKAEELQKLAEAEAKAATEADKAAAADEASEVENDNNPEAGEANERQKNKASESEGTSEGQTCAAGSDCPPNGKQKASNTEETNQQQKCTAGSDCPPDGKSVAIEGTKCAAGADCPPDKRNEANKHQNCVAGSDCPPYGRKEASEEEECPAGSCPPGDRKLRKRQTMTAKLDDKNHMNADEQELFNALKAMTSEDLDESEEDAELKDSQDYSESEFADEQKGMDHDEQVEALFEDRDEGDEWFRKDEKGLDKRNASEFWGWFSNRYAEDADARRKQQAAQDPNPLQQWQQQGVEK